MFAISCGELTLLLITVTTVMDQTNLCVDRLHNVDSSFNGDDDNRP